MNKPLGRIVYAVFFVAPLIVSIGFCATLNVPSVYSTIRDGLDAAVAGDTVLVAGGTYAGEGNKDIDLLGKAVTVRSENGPEVTVIDCEGSGRGFYCNNAETGSTVIEGFTVRNGSVSGAWPEHAGGGFFLYGSSPVVRDCIIVNNEAVNGGGVFIHDGSPIISGCRIEGNTGAFGAGIECSTRSAARIENSVIAGNGPAAYGGGICCRNYDATVTVINCTFYGNSARWGGAVSCYNTENCPVFAFCTITGNTAEYAGGGLACANSYPYLLSCILWDNTGILEIYGYPIVNYSDIEGGYTGVGEGNIDADPEFLAPGSDDYHLAYGSPCIDAGADWNVYTDMDDEVRPNGGGYDIGADEFWGDPGFRILPGLAR